MTKYFYKQFKRLFELMEIQEQWRKNMNTQFKWAESEKEQHYIREIILMTDNRLQTTRKQLIDDLREKLMIRIRRKTGIDMEYKWLEHIAYIDDDGKQSNLYGLSLSDEVTGGQKGVIIIAMRTLATSQRRDMRLWVELRESDEDRVALYHDGGWQQWRLWYRLDSYKRKSRRTRYE